ncbi:MAG: hypothetical protein WCS30_00050 [Selenomonadaceae bacterium]
MIKTCIVQAAISVKKIRVYVMGTERTVSADIDVPKHIDPADIIIGDRVAVAFYSNGYGSGVLLGVL